MSNEIVPRGGSVVTSPSQQVVPPGGGLPGTTVNMQRKVAAQGGKAVDKSGRQALQFGMQDEVVRPPPQSADEAVADFSKALLADGVHRDDINKAVKWYEAWAARESAIEQQLDEQDREACKTDLRRLWGRGSYEADLRTAIAAFRALPAAIQATLETGTLPDGSMGLNAPATWLWLHELGTRRSSSRGGGAPDSLDAEIASIETMMKDKTGPYWKGPRAAAIQARYLELVSKSARVR